MDHPCQAEVLELLSARRGHFLLESGHHGDLWLELESLCLYPHRVRKLADSLADELSEFDADVVCGPLVEGAFVALMVAEQLHVPFTYTERFAQPSEDGLFPAAYRLPAPLREEVRGRRVAIVNDVINAGSAVRGTLADLEACGAEVVAVGALLILGEAFSAFAMSRNVPVKSVAKTPNQIWMATECPMCQAEIPLEDIASFKKALQP